MKAIVIISFIIVATCQISLGQSIPRQVFSNGGINNSDGQVVLSSTIGEAIDQTLVNNDILLRQGFEQPIVDTAIATFTINQLEVQVLVYPNPTIDYINIQIPQFSNLKTTLQAHLFDIQGRSVLNLTLQDDHNRINLSELAAANYVLRILDPTNQQFEVFKIEKLK